MLSVIILTKNEEDRIKACLESVKWAGEIIVVDNGSTDKTLEIAKKYTNKIIFSKDEDFAKARNKGIEQAQGDWVLYVDSDERVLENLRKEIEELTNSSDQSAFAISRRNIIFGKEVNYGPYKKDWMIRLFKRENFENWVGQVHEHPIFRGKLGYTKNSLLHLTHRNIDQMVLKSLEWSKIDAKLRYDANHPKMTSLRFIRILISETLNQGIKRGGFFNGTIGVMDSLVQVFSMVITYIRLWQMQQKNPLDDTYNQIDKNLIDNDFKY